MHASLRPQSGHHGLVAVMGGQSLYVYIVDVQIANLDVGREHFVICLMINAGRIGFSKSNKPPEMTRLHYIYLLQQMRL